MNERRRRRRRPYAGSRKTKRADGRAYKDGGGGIKFLITLQCQWEKRNARDAAASWLPVFFSLLLLFFFFPSSPLSIFSFFSSLYLFFFFFFLICQRRRKCRRLPILSLDGGLSLSPFLFIFFSPRGSLPFPRFVCTQCRGKKAFMQMKQVRARGSITR